MSIIDYRERAKERARRRRDYPHARLVRSWWQRITDVLTARNSRIIVHCVRCGHRTAETSYNETGTFCHGSGDMAMPGEPPCIICIVLVHRLG